MSQLLRLSTTRHVANRTIRQRCRAYATHQQPPSQPQRAAPRSSLISQKTAKEWKELSTPQKVVAASKATVNVGVILAGVAVTGSLLFLIGKELFGSDSTTAIFSDAVDRINAHQEVSELLGKPIKAHGEPSRKRNRRVQHQIVEDGQGNPHLFMRFYLEGQDNRGTALLEMIKDESGSWQYKRLLVDVPGQGYPSRRYFIEGQQ
ncbi:hypothetical protein LRAMOSA01520 [Lichtheimia ramosa]|uniref:Mitochondrial import inner membrane translocase subunit Tim21 n=1 Tax=Lichtheimia ramosa TaxID=688394 RepID=A0A077WIJ5_9FUNG|nr:hypothetical protein LRAMOSA01520 [Lichtheimia ramosa]